MTRAKDISKILTDADISGTLDVSGAFTSQGIDDNADATAITIDSAERVGIGTSSPDSNHKLEVTSGGTSEVGIRSGNSNEAILNFGRANDRLRGRIAYNNSSEYLAFWTNQGEKMRISSSGGVGINTSSPTSGYMLHVGGSSGVHTKVKIEATTATGQAELDLSADPAGVSYLNLGDEDAYNIGRIGYFHSNNSMRFNTNSSERLRIDNAGNIYSNVTVNPVSQSGTTTTGQILLANSYAAFGRVGGITAYFNRQHSDGDVIAIRQDGSDEGTISVSGTTVSYNAFSGSHWSRLADNSKPTILKGTVIETIDEMCDWYQAKFTIPATTKKDDDGNEIQDTPEQTIKDSIALPSGKKVGDTISHTYEGVTYDNAVIIKEGDNKHPKCKISDTADSVRVYGVHADWDNDDDTVNDMYVTAVGTHVVRINKDVTVSAGDLLSSNGDGTAKVQDDDIIRSKTIGKVLTNIKQETYSDGSYTVPCALYCG